MSPHEWTLTDAPPEADLLTVSAGVLSHGRALAVGGNARTLACLVRAGGRLVAGGYGRTEFDRLFVSHLWVDAPLRGQGLGREILGRLEVEALRRGCASAVIETLIDDAARLFERQGYRPLATLERWVGPFTRHVMLKTLLPGAGSA